MDTTNHLLKFWNGTAWTLAGMAAGTGLTLSGGALSIDSSVVQAKSEKGSANGYASLDSGGKVPSSQIPLLNTIDVSVVASQAAQLALTAQEGDIAIRTDLNKTYVHNGGSAGTMADWTELATPTDAVTSVNGMTGAVTGLAALASVQTFTAKQTIDPGSGDILKLDAAAAADKWLELTKAGTAKGSLYVGASDEVSLTSANGMVLETSSGSIVINPASGAAVNVNSHVISNVANAASGGDAVSRNFGDGRYSAKGTTITNAAGSGGSMVFTHNLGTKKVVATIRRVSDDVMIPMWKGTNATNTVTVEDPTNPSAGTYEMSVVPCA